MEGFTLNDTIRVENGKLKSSYEEAYGVKPLGVSAQTTIRTQMYAEYLWRLFCGNVTIDIPNYWNIEYFLQNLLIKGSVAISMVEGVLCFYPFSIIEWNRFRSPARITSTDPYIDVESVEVGNECVIYSLTDVCESTNRTPDISKLIDLYSARLANVDGAVDMNLINSRMSFLFEVENSSDEFKFKEMYTKVMNGDPAVFFRKGNTSLKENNGKLPITTLPVRDNYMVNEMLESKSSIVSEFLTTIGINNVSFEKKERLITGEVNANNIQTQCALQHWQDHLEMCSKTIKKRFGVDVLVKFRSLSNIGKGGASNESGGFDTDTSNIN